jgi:hypothetical protein
LIKKNNFDGDPDNKMRDHFGEIVQQKLSDVVHRTGTVTEGGSRQSFSLVKGVSRDSNVGVAR